MILVQAISNRGKNRIGTKPTVAFVEQSFADRIFIVFRNELGEMTQCRWIKEHNDPDFRILNHDLPN
jgi:hypothetical protein